MGDAIKPDKFVGPYWERVVKRAEKAGSSQEEIALSDIASSNGWKILTDEMDRMVEELDDSLANQVAAGADFADIGKTALIKEIVKSYILRLKNRVQDAREAINRAAGE